ncbi:MAG: ABC transporter permease [Chloroflexi bacterium]|nr:ABC transporter permease [Chloroflexota bacterium]
MDVLLVPRLLGELVVYLALVIPDLLPIVLGLATPLALGALCGVLNERSGVVNIGIEGIMLMAAFTGYLAGFATHAEIGAAAALALGVIVAVVTGALLGLLHAWLCVTVRADQVIAGTILNVGAFGMTAYFNRLIITPSGEGGAGVIPSVVLGLGPIAFATLALVGLVHFLLYRSRWGLRTRAVGEHPKAADTVGINVFRVRYQSVIAGCALAGLGGAYLTLESTGSFQNGMTGGRGFIALAAVVFGRWTPLGAWGGALLFGAFTALGVIVRVRPAAGEVGALLAAIPSFWYAALPYLVTIVILAGVVGRAVPPAADGIPYDKEARA